MDQGRRESGPIGGVRCLPGRVQRPMCFLCFHHATDIEDIFVGVEERQSGVDDGMCAGRGYHEIIREYPGDDVHRLHFGDPGVGDDDEKAHRPWAPLGNAAGALSFCCRSPWGGDWSK